MFKNIIAPVQAWLMSQGKCVGCGRKLRQSKGNGLTRIDCVCGRVYMYDSGENKYRRASLDEIK